MTTTTQSRDAALGRLLQYWRRVRGKSQLDLAGQAQVSARHLSFLETGRSNPSREMVITLATALEVPLRERNALLVAAGYAPLYREANLGADELAPARRAVDYILRHQEPFPAIVMDRHWNILSRNDAAGRFFALLAGTAAPPGTPNVVRNIFHPAGLRPWIENWEDVADAVIQRVHREAVGGVLDEGTRRLLAEVLHYPGVPAKFHTPNLTVPLQPLVALNFKKNEFSASFFSTVTTLGTPQDITLEEIRIECFFPADPETERRARALG